MRPRLLDLFCGAGGCSVGYHRAGFDVTGVDIELHTDYPFDFVHANAMHVLTDMDYLRTFDVIHASPPCQRYSVTSSLHDADHPDLVGPVRAALLAWGGTYVIENVEGAPLPGALVLCGTEFGLRSNTGYWLRRHRLFESNVFLLGAGGCHCAGKRTAHVTGHLPAATYKGRSGNQMGRMEAHEAMGIDWMSNSDLVQAIPPVYTQWIGEQLLTHIAAVTP